MMTTEDILALEKPINEILESVSTPGNDQSIRLQVVTVKLLYEILSELKTRPHVPELNPIRELQVESKV